MHRHALRCLPSHRSGDGSRGCSNVHVGAGATWHELLTALDREGWSVAVMQSNDDFTIGGSISVNCHGWQPNSPPIASTVEAFRILLADGSVRECRHQRSEDRELFGAVCGGYGLFGIILDVDLRVVPNALYRAQEFPATSTDYAQRFEGLVEQSSIPSGLAYGRISIAPGPWFLRDARIIRFVAAPQQRQATSQRPWIIQRGSSHRNHGRSIWRARPSEPLLAATLGSSDDGRLSDSTDKLIASCRAMEF